MRLNGAGVCRTCVVIWQTWSPCMLRAAEPRSHHITQTLHPNPTPSNTNRQTVPVYFSIFVKPVGSPQLWSDSPLSSTTHSPIRWSQEAAQSSFTAPIPWCPSSLQDDIFFEDFLFPFFSPAHLWKAETTLEVWTISKPVQHGVRWRI